MIFDSPNNIFPKNDLKTIPQIYSKNCLLKNDLIMLMVLYDSCSIIKNTGNSLWKMVYN